MLNQKKKAPEFIVFAIKLIDLLLFKGADFDTAKQALTVNNFNVEQALNYHLERVNGAIGAPEDDVAGKIANTVWIDQHFGFPIKMSVEMAV